MHVIRPVQNDDVDALVALAELTSFGLTSLPRDRALLERRVREARAAFERTADEPPRGESYLFVLEETQSGEVVGTSGIVSKVGGFEPFYAYQIETSVHESKMLNVRKEIHVLHLLIEHNGPCEIGSLFLHPELRQRGAGRALSLARFLFMAEYPSLFDETVIAEMRGVIDRQGRSAFWDAIGRHFFDLDLPTADYLSVVNKQFIADLMPRHPIYIPLLPRAAQAVIGQVHDETAGARRILEQEGFAFSEMVDIFEAGPILRCPRDRIRTVEASCCAPATVVDELPGDAATHLISTSSVARNGFRACWAPAVLNDAGDIKVTVDVITALGVNTGDPLRCVPLRADTGRGEVQA